MQIEQIDPTRIDRVCLIYLFHLLISIKRIKYRKDDHQNESPEWQAVAQESLVRAGRQTGRQKESPAGVVGL